MEVLKPVGAAFAFGVLLVLLYVGIPMGTVQKPVTVLSTQTIHARAPKYSRGLKVTAYLSVVRLGNGEVVELASYGEPIKTGNLRLSRSFSVLRFRYVYSIEN